MTTRIWRRGALLALLVLALSAVTACGDDDNNNNDTGNNAANNDTNNEPNNDENNEPNNDVNNDGPTGEYADAKATEIDEELPLEGLSAPVHVTFDEFGIPHILAESLIDAVTVQGYLHARDRLAQMELIRRTVNGEVAEVAGALDPGTLNDDLFQRMVGFKRMGKLIYDSLPDGGRDKRVIEAYSAGINQYYAKVRDGDERIPNEVLLLVTPSRIRDWSPVDSLALVRFQQYLLSFDSFREIRLTRGFESARQTFSADAEDPALAAREGIFYDLHRFAPADPFFINPGFTADRDDSKSDELGVGGLLDNKRPHPKLNTLANAERVFGPRQSEIYQRIAPLRKGASNSWAVAGALTDTGNAMLANDPHLALDSPTLFYETHLVVEPGEGADPEEQPLNAFGQQFPGLPGLLLGHNDKLAWALTTASYDYTDAYLETLVQREGEEFPRVLHNGEEVELEVVEEEIIVATGIGSPPETITVRIPIVPHRNGPMVMDISDGQMTLPEGDEALSLAWRGFEASNELAALIDVLYADNVQEADKALDNWVIGSQNWLFADIEGNLLITGKSYIPKRPAEAMTFDQDDNPDGTAPWFVLSGTGEHDWEGSLTPEQVPHEVNPDRNFVVTANNDQTGTTADNNPFNDPHPYIGYDYDLGYRAGRIERLVTNADDNRDGQITFDDMVRYQGDTYSDYGEVITPFLIAAAERALEEYDAPDTHPDLAPVLAEHPEGRASLQQARDMLAGWNFEASNGLFGEPTEAEKEQSRATSVFNFWQTATIRQAFFDELRAAEGFGPTSQQLSKGLVFLLTTPEQTRTLDPGTGQSIIWDNLETPDVQESRDALILLAFFEALEQLEQAFGSDDPADWIWGQVHTRRFASIIPSLAPEVPHPFTIPQPAEGQPAGGFPMDGDNYNVDVCNGGITDYRYSCTGGATMRMIVELDPNGIKAYNAIPGGQVWDSRSDHFRDQLELWLNNERHLNRVTPAQVSEAVNSHSLFTP